jgi:hypothetical protein
MMLQVNNLFIQTRSDEKLLVDFTGFLRILSAILFCPVIIFTIKISTGIPHLVLLIGSRKAEH